MNRLKTDRDIAVYLRNAALALRKIAQEYGINISIHCRPEGHTDVRFGDYEYWLFCEGGKKREIYSYEPAGDIASWRHNVKPEEIRLGQSPASI